jgi:hypothetical protein
MFELIVAPLTKCYPREKGYFVASVGRRGRKKRKS